MKTIIAKYLSIFLLTFVVLNYGILVANDKYAKQHVVENLQLKLELFEQHSGEFDTIFIGDSRTYCDIHPHLLDPLMGTHSINLATWAHWFPTQYPFVRDLVGGLKPGQVVVFSVGHQNFSGDKALSAKYPLHFSDIPLYLQLGWRLNPVLTNVLSGYPAMSAIRFRDSIMSFESTLADRPLLRIGAASGKESGEIPANDGLARQIFVSDINNLAASYKAMPGIQDVAIKSDNNKPVGLEVRTERGSYIRVEYDHEYFRMKQRENLESMGGALSDREAEMKTLPASKMDPDYMELFRRILAEFKSHNVQLIVNEVEEAPYTYRNPQLRDKHRKLMEIVRAEVQQQGIPYIRVDWDKFDDSDYFDYNHLNSKGVDKFTPLFAEQFRTALVQLRNNRERGQ